jgi:hypothetical protein
MMGYDGSAVGWPLAPWQLMQIAAFAGAAGAAGADCAMA